MIHPHMLQNSYNEFDDRLELSMDVLDDFVGKVEHLLSLIPNSLFLILF